MGEIRHAEVEVGIFRGNGDHFPQLVPGIVEALAIDEQADEFLAQQRLARGAAEDFAEAPDGGIELALGGFELGELAVDEEAARVCGGEFGEFSGKRIDAVLAAVGDGDAGDDLAFEP